MGYEALPNWDSHIQVVPWTKYENKGHPLIYPLVMTNIAIENGHL